MPPLPGNNSSDSYKLPSTSRNLDQSPLDPQSVLLPADPQLQHDLDFPVMSSSVLHVLDYHLYYLQKPSPDTRTFPLYLPAHRWYM